MAGIQENLNALRSSGQGLQAGIEQAERIRNLPIDRANREVDLATKQFNLSNAEELAPIEAALQRLKIEQGEQGLRNARQSILASQENVLASQQDRGIRQQQQQQQNKLAKQQEQVTQAIQAGRIAQAAKGFDTPGERIEFFQSVSPALRGLGLDISKVDSNDVTDASLDKWIAAGRAFSPNNNQERTAQQKDFDFLSQGLAQEDIDKARRIRLGLDPRATGSAIQTITDLNLGRQIGATEAEIEGAKEEAKLIKQLKLKPEIENAVTRVVASAKADADLASEAKSNDKALMIYETAFSGLSEALGNTNTGPFFGMMPAFTTEGQIADAAVAATLPILKTMFRSAGEGTFTEGDQKILTNLIPTRKTKSDAAKAQLKALDDIVRSKLGANNDGEANDVMSEIEMLERELGL